MGLLCSLFVLFSYISVYSGDYSNFTNGMHTLPGMNVSVGYVEKKVVLLYAVFRPMFLCIVQSLL